MRSGSGTRSCCPLEAERRISNTSALTMETSRVLVGDKVSAAEIFLPAFKMGGSEFQNQVSESAGVPFFRPIVSTHFRPPDLPASSDTVDPPSLAGTLAWLGFWDAMSPGFSPLTSCCFEAPGWLLLIFLAP